MGILIVAAGLVCAALAVFAVAGAVYFVLTRKREAMGLGSGGGTATDHASNAHYLSAVPFAFDSPESDLESATEAATDAESSTSDAGGSSESYADSSTSDSGWSDSGSSDSGSSGSSGWSD